MASILDQLVTYIRITSAYGPDIILDRPFAPAIPGEKPFLGVIKPRVEIGLKGANPVVVAPYGDPGPSQWGALMLAGGLAGGVLLALAIYGGYRLAVPALSVRSSPRLPSGKPPKNRRVSYV